MAGRDIEKECTKRLRAELDKGAVVDAKRAYRVLELVGNCLLPISRDVDALTIQVFGNGTPGGLRADVAALRNELQALRLMLDDGRRDRRKEDVEQPTLSDKITLWIIDKVLPTLVSQAILFIVLLLGAVFVWRSVGFPGL